jgi:hypothetical protein
MLGQHPQLFGLPELHLFVAESMQTWWGAFRWERHVAAHGLVRAVAQLYYGEQTDETAQLARGWIQGRLGSDTTSVFRELAEKAHPRILVEKSPSTINHPARLCRLRETFPNARFLHLVRHPRGTCESIVAWRFLRNNLAYNPTAWDRGTDPPTFDPQNFWYASHTNICHFLASIPAERQMRVRGEDLLRSPDQRLPEIVEWLGLPSTSDAIDLMKHPERSPFARFGPAGARWGNDPAFLRNPALRPERVRTYCLDGPVSWRADGAGLSPDVRALAREFGYR